MNPISNIPTAPCATLADVVDELIALKQISNEKYYASYLIAAKRVWQRLFWNTIWVIKNEWKSLKKGDPYNYIDVPYGSVRLLSISDVDRHGKIIPLYYNEQLNVIPRPTTPDCGCGACDCTGSQDDLSGYTFTTKLLFTINGNDFYEKEWLKYCTNGDILRYREVPTKKYNTVTSTLGDFNNDFDNDFNIGNPSGSNFEIVKEVFQEKVCQLTLRPCGCPDDTVENLNTFQEACGCTYFNWWFKRRHQENPLFVNINNNHLGEIKMGECGTKIYYVPGKDCGIVKLPKELLVAFQSSGNAKYIDDMVTVPEFCYEAMFTGIDYELKRYNNSFSGGQKKEAEWANNDAVNKVIMFLNPISLDWLQNVQDRPVIW